MAAIEFTTSEWIDLAIAGATLFLALGTFWMAIGTRALARTTQRQHAESITPVLRLARVSPPGDIDMHITNEGLDEFFIVVVENLGPVAAEIESCHMTDLGEGEGRDDLAIDPVIQRDEGREVDFRQMDAAAKERLCSGEVKIVTVTYVAVATGHRYRVVEKVRCKMEGSSRAGGVSRGPRERWVLVEGGAPKTL